MHVDDDALSAHVWWGQGDSCNSVLNWKWSDLDSGGGVRRDSGRTTARLAAADHRRHEMCCKAVKVICLETVLLLTAFAGCAVGRGLAEYLFRFRK